MQFKDAIVVDDLFIGSDLVATRTEASIALTELATLLETTLLETTLLAIAALLASTVSALTIATLAVTALLSAALLLWATAEIALTLRHVVHISVVAATPATATAAAAVRATFVLLAGLASTFQRRQLLCSDWNSHPHPASSSPVGGRRSAPDWRHFVEPVVAGVQEHCCLREKRCRRPRWLQSGRRRDVSVHGVPAADRERREAKSPRLNRRASRQSELPKRHHRRRQRLWVCEWCVVERWALQWSDSTHESTFSSVPA